jgi:hypothetical protein
MRILPFLLKILTLAAGLMAASTTAASSLHSECRATPEEAVDSSSSQKDVALQGFRVSALRWDPFLQQQWAVVISCAHPALPPLTLRVPGGSSRHVDTMKASLPVIRRGDVIHAWSQEPFVRIERTGVAEGDAALGDRVRIRIIRSLSTDAAETGISNNNETLSGIVRGRHNVEIEP